MMSKENTENENENENENDSSSTAAITTKNNKTWNTWEELLVAYAVKRHGFKDWDSVAMELQIRCSPPSFFTAQVCKDKFRQLHRRYTTDNSNNNHESNDAAVRGDDFGVYIDGGDVKIPWLDELRQLRVQELKQEVQRYDLSIQSLQSKVKEMEKERKQSSESPNDVVKPDLVEDVKEERSENDKNSGGGGVKLAGKAVSGEESDRENQSFNESNSAENREIAMENETDLVKTGDDVKLDPEAKLVGEEGDEDSYNDSSKMDRESENLRDSVSVSVSVSVSESKEGTSDVQSTASLTTTTKKRRRRVDEVSRIDGGGDAAALSSPAAMKVVDGGGGAAVKSEPFIGVLDIIRSHKRGSVFERRLDSQKTDKYKSMIRKHMDLETVQACIDDGSYSSCPDKFYLDLLLIFTNAVVYFPNSSPESAAANELRCLVMKELKKYRAQPKTHSPEPGPGPEPEPAPVKIQPKPELERSDSLLAKHKSTAPIIVCRKRSSISAKPTTLAVVNNKQETTTQADNKPPLNPKPPIKSSSNEEQDSPMKLRVKEKPVTGVRSMRRSSKGRPNNNNVPSQSNNSTPNTSAKQTSTATTTTTTTATDKKEDKKPEKKKDDSKKRGAVADFLKRIKKTSPTKGTLVEALKTPVEDVPKVSNKKEPQKKKVDDRREPPARRSSGVKDDGSPSKRSVGRPPKRGGGSKEAVPEKRGRENSEKDDSSKRPKKRSRR